jgi:hypothetical protein
MEFGTTEWILISYFIGAVARLVLGWLMWKDDKKPKESSQGIMPTVVHSAMPNTSSEKDSKAI